MNEWGANNTPLSFIPDQVYNKVMTKNDLIEKLRGLPSGDEERDHALADDLLLEYIDDLEVSDAFNSIPKWYA